MDIDAELNRRVPVLSRIINRNSEQINESFVTQVDAAGQVRNAGLDAAKLRQAAAVIAQVGREISREVGQGMRIRF